MYGSDYDPTGTRAGSSSDPDRQPSIVATSHTGILPIAVNEPAPTPRAGGPDRSATDLLEATVDRVRVLARSVAEVIEDIGRWGGTPGAST